MRAHGTRSRYVDGCRCEPCKQANRDAARKRGMFGFETTLVDSAVSREHVLMLQRTGMGRREIARRSGVAESIVGRLLGMDRTKPARRVRPETQERLLAVRPGVVADHALVPIKGSQRRLQALVAIGWTQSCLAERLGWTPSNFTGLINGHRTHVIQATATAVKELYAELEMTPGPSQRARNHASQRGWPPPAAWDEWIDDTSRSPDRWASLRIRRESA